MRLIRSYGRFGPSTLDPWLIRDRAAARASLERILAWDFDRVIVAHGDVLERGGHDAARRTGIAGSSPARRVSHEETHVPLGVERLRERRFVGVLGRLAHHAVERLRVLADEDAPARRRARRRG